MDLLVVNLSRVQFAITVISHFIFVATTVGILTITLINELIFAFGKGENNEHYGRAALFFAKIAFLSFGSGVVTGLVMEFQFGMNWSEFSEFFGDIVGVPIALESLTAFFIESALMGLWRFTWGKINKKIHVIIGVFILISSLFSIFWIIMVNAFLQNPVGYTVEDGVAKLDSLGSLITNPQYRPEALHVFCAIMILGGMVCAGISAHQILRKKDVEIFKKTAQIGLLLALPFAIIQPLFGDAQIVASSSLEPMKFAAAEAQYEDEGGTDTGVPWALIAWADEDALKTYGIFIPDLGSYVMTGEFTGTSSGMISIAEYYHEIYDNYVQESYNDTMDYYLHVNIMFPTFRYMILSGDFYAIFAALAMILLNRKKKSIEQHPRTLKFLTIVMWLPYATVISGWIVAEVGRYPFVVYGVLTQADAVSPSMTLPKIITTLCIFAGLDALLIISMLIMSRKFVKQGAPDINDKSIDEPDHISFFGKGIE